MDPNYEKRYNALMECLRQMHERNVKRTSIALRSLLIVPTVFLVMLFFTNSSKTIFLVLWIVSMFIIATILIVIEYEDFTLRKMIAKIISDEDEPTEIAENAASVTDNDPRADVILEAIRSHLPTSDAQVAESDFKFDNPKEESTADDGE